MVLASIFLLLIIAMVGKMILDVQKNKNSKKHEIENEDFIQ